MMKTACVLGAGNSAHATAALISSLPDWSCHVYAPRKDRAELWRQGISRGGILAKYGPDDGNARVQGTPDKVSKHPEEVIPGCQVLIMCLPAQAFEENARDAAPFVDEGAMIGTICATNGFDWCVDAAMARVGRARDSYGVFALQNLPWACRADDYGYSVEVLGAKPFMEITARPDARLPEIADIMSRLIRIKCPPVPGGFLGIGLSNLCQVIHPAVMYGNFASWDGRTPFETPPLFYQGLDEPTAEMMDQVSNEILSLCAVLKERYPSLDLSVVHHIFPWCMRAYGKYIDDDSTLLSRFATNRAYTGLTCPMLPVEGGYVPDFSSRYLSEDVPYNLVAVLGLAKLCQVPVPTIERVVEWAQGALGQEFLADGELRGKDLALSFAPQKFGFEKLEDIPELAELG